MERLEIKGWNSKTCCSILLAAFILAPLGTGSAQTTGMTDSVSLKHSGERLGSPEQALVTASPQLGELSNAPGQQGLSTTAETLPMGQLSRTLSGKVQQKDSDILSGPRSAWQNIFNEPFEGAFPGSSWTLYGNPTWDDTSDSYHGGSSSGWCAGSALPPSGGYVNNMNAWMVYGPFSLADAASARVNFWYKNSSEPNFDYFKWLASTDGVNFSGYKITGDHSTWRTQTFDLANVPTLGDLSGQAEVWIAFVFSSDSSDAGPAYTGTFTDDIVIEKDVGSASPPVIRIDPLTVIFSGEARALTESRSVAMTDPGGQTPLVSQTPTPIPMDQKLIDSLQIMDGLDQGPTTMVVVNLTSPRAVVAATDFRSQSSLIGLQVEMKKLQREVLDSLPGNGVKARFRFHNISAFSAEVTAQGLRALQAHPRVVSIEPVYILHPHLAQGISLIQGMSYRSSYNGSGMAIAICDTGIDYNHPRLGGGGFPNSKVLGGYDFGDSDSDPIPNGLAHGTACAGIAAGGLGTVGDYIGGVAYNAKLYALKISSGAAGSATSDAMVAAWDWCVTHKNDNPDYPILVISTSFGGGRYFSAGDGAVPSMTAAANNAEAAGITVLASSGNDGYCDSIAWPACISSVIAVGGVYDAAFGHYYPCVDPAACAPKIADSGCLSGYYADDLSEADEVTSYANTATILGLLAPANQCYTLDISGSAGYSSGDYYDSFGGTSAACPYAAGAVACLQAAAKARTGSYLTPQEVRNRLVSNGDEITDSKSPITKPRVNLERTIQSLPNSGQSFRIYNDGGGTLTVNSITKETSAPWITFAPAASFDVAAGGHQEVTVLVDFAQAPVGQSTTRLLVVSNDADRSPYPGGVDVSVMRTIPSTIADADGDGMPDDWEIANGLNPDDASDAAKDFDGDGFTNLQELGAGTDPLNPSDAIGITDTRSIGSDVQISFRTVLGKSYFVESNDNFPSGLWTPVANNVPGTGGVVQLIDLNGGAQPKRFYRVRAVTL